MVTNAHVVWPFQEVRVVFPDGSVFPSAPVMGWDLIGDLAIIGPLDTAIDPVELVDGEGLIIGSEVFLIGYPGELEGLPQPAITGGIISRMRQWDAMQISYFQTDATIAGGQSGGVLVSDRGDVIGISGFTFTEAGFGLVASAADVLSRVEGLVAGEDVDGLGDRRLPLDEGVLETDVTVLNLWHTVSYVINEPAGTAIEVSVAGETDSMLLLLDVLGNVLVLADDAVTGTESGTTVTELSAPHFLLVAHFSEEPAEYRVKSNVRLAALEDADDGKAVAVGQTVLAGIDAPFEIDYFSIALEEGETIEITVDSIMIDPILSVAISGATEFKVMDDDNSGVGLLGLNAKLTYRAPATASYFILVSDADLSATGGYLLTVAEAAPGAAAVSPDPKPAQTTIDSPFGPMSWYDSARYPFSIQYPAGWPQGPAQAGVTASFDAPTGDNLTISEVDLAGGGLGQTTVAQYVDLLIGVTPMVIQDWSVVSREQRLSPGGQQVIALHATSFGGLVTQFVLVYVHERSIVFTAIYTGPTTRQQEIQDLFDYSFGTFRVGSEE